MDGGDEGEEGEDDEGDEEDDDEEDEGGGLLFTPDIYTLVNAF